MEARAGAETVAAAAHAARCGSVFLFLVFFLREEMGRGEIFTVSGRETVAVKNKDATVIRGHVAPTVTRRGLRPYLNNRNLGYSPQALIKPHH